MRVKRVMILVLISAMILNLVVTRDVFDFFEVNASSYQTKIIAGEAHSILLRRDGTVWAWGENENGQLGIGTTVDSTVPVQVSNLENIIDIDTFRDHNIALKSDGTVWTWGHNNWSQLGHGTNVDILEPTKVESLTDVESIAAGYLHTVVSKSDGTVWTWGNNSDGQIGNGTKDSQLTPTQATGLNGVVKVSAGLKHTLAVTEDGTLYGWGRNSYYQLASNDTSDVLIPIEISAISNVKSIDAGDYHTIVILEDKTVWCWGSNAKGQLGNNSYSNSPTPQKVLDNGVYIDAGSDTSFAVTEDFGGQRQLWGWGQTYYDLIGDDTINDMLIPTSINTTEAITQVSAYYSHAVAVTSRNEVLVWGWDMGNRLGITSSTPVKPDLNLPIIDIELDSFSVSDITETTANASWSVSSPIQGLLYKVGTYNEEGHQVHETEWITDLSTTIEGLEPGKYYDILLKIKTGTGFEEDWTQIGLIETKEWGLDLNLLEVSANSAVIKINDDSPNSVEYQVKCDEKYVNHYGELVDEQTWIAVTDSKVPISNLNEMTKYTFSVISKSSTGNISSESDRIHVETLRATPELDLPEVTIGDGDDREIVVNISDSNSDKTVYQIIVGDKYVNAAGLLTDSPVWLMLPTPKSITVKNIEVNKSYGIKVRAQNNIGEVTYWTEPKYKTVYEEVPGTPSNFATTVVDDTITITWNEVTTGSVEEPKHNVNYELEVDGEVIDMKYGRTYVHEALKPNTTHAYRVRSYNDAGHSEWTSYSYATIKMKAPSVSDINVIAERVEDTMVTIAWEEDPNILTYTIDFNGIIVSDIRTNFYKMYGLTPDTAYTYKIMGQNTIAATSWTTEETVVTKHLATPVIELDSVNTRELIIQWEPVEGASQYYVALYKEEETVNDITDNAVKVNVGSATKAVFGSDKIEPNQSYKVKIYADSTNGISEWSHYIVVSSLPIKPAKVDNPIAMALDSTIELFWGSVTQSEESTPIDIVGYDILIDASTDEDGEISGGILVEDSLDTELVNETEVATDYQSFSHDYVYPVTTHNYRIRANTVEVSGDWSDEIAVTTLSGIPLVPRGIRMDTVGNVTTINWENMPGVTAYEVYVSSEQKIYTVTENEFINRDVPFGVEELYMIRATNDLGKGDWSGYLINNTMRLQSAYGEAVDLNLTASNILDFSPYVLHVYYNADVLTVRDLCGKTPIFETEAGVITLGDDSIEITEVEPGHITFTVDKEIELGYTWEGIINNIIFEGNISGGTTLDYTVFVDESITWGGIINE